MELTDLEICKRIAEIEGVLFFDDGFDLFIPDYEASMSTGYDEDKEYNPLTDDALCFQFMVKDKIRLVYEYDGTWLCFSNDTANNLLSKSSNPNKAVCLAKIELNK
jgi:hypothetical protein